METKFFFYTGHLSTACAACSETETSLQMLFNQSRHSKFKNHYKLLMYERLQTLRENKDKLKKLLDESYQQIENEIKKLPID